MDIYMYVSVVHFSIYVSVMPYIGVFSTVGQMKGNDEKTPSKLRQYLLPIMAILLPTIRWPIRCFPFLSCRLYVNWKLPIC